jgi:hypothetical protein
MFTISVTSFNHFKPEGGSEHLHTANWGYNALADNFEHVSDTVEGWLKSVQAKENQVWK